jgi:hypothetical protein
MCASGPAFLGRGVQDGASRFRRFRGGGAILLLAVVIHDPAPAATSAFLLLLLLALPLFIIYVPVTVLHDCAPSGAAVGAGIPARGADDELITVGTVLCV